MSDPVRFLDDVRVLEVASLAPTQLAMHLADLGAEVIKIEVPNKGDATRLIGLRPGFSDSALHRRWNRGKKSLALDMTTPEGIDLVRDLIRHVDIVIEGLRPGTMERMGLGWSDLVALKPNLVMIALSGYGQSGPYRDKPSHGIGFDAVSGLAPAEQDERGRPRVVPRHLNVGTILAPLFGATHALAALSWSRRTGQPVFLDVAQADAATFANFAVEDAASERSRAAAGTASGSPAGLLGEGGPAADSSTMQYYRTRDDKVLLLMALERKFFVRLVEAVGRPDLVGHFPADRYADGLQGNDELRDALLEAIASKDLSEWLRIFAEADVPVVPVNDSSQVLDDPQLGTRIEWLPGDQGTVTMKTPVRSEPPTAPPRPAASIGRDTAEVLAMIGVDDAGLERLAQAGVIQIGADT